MSNLTRSSQHRDSDRLIDLLTAAASPWFVLRTQSRRETYVERYLQEKGVECYLPVKSVGLRQGMPIREPFFPTYLFFRFSAGTTEWPLVRWAPGTREVVAFGDVPATMPDALVRAIRERLTRAEPALGASLFQRGDPVEVVKGAFSGLDAIFDGKISGARRALILIDMLGRQVRAQVPIEQLRATR